MLLLAAAVLYTQTPHAQTPPDAAAVLNQARAKVLATMRRIPKYACLQTIDRMYYAPAKPHHGTPCGQDAKTLRLDDTDRLRLDVAKGTRDEIHSWPGASAFDMTEIDQIVDSGPFGTGSFGGYLLDIFDNDATQFDFRGQQARGGQQVLVYGYTVARSASHYEIRTYSSWATVGYSGTFEVNPESLEIERVILQARQLPAETGLCEATSTLDYQRVEIGDGSFLLPRESHLHMIVRNGQESDNTTAFSNCREYQAQSDVRFVAPPVMPEKAAEAAPKPPVPGPPPRRYVLDLRIDQSIDTETSAAGDPISATVVHDVHPYQSKEVAIPAGAVAHGRISRVEHHFVPFEYLAIGISFQSLEIAGETSPFTAKPVGSGAAVVAPVGAGSTAAPPRMVTDGPFPLTAMPQVRTLIGPPNSLVFPYRKHYVMPAGTVSQWLAVYPPRGAAK
jgi:hypothetical protein